MKFILIIPNARDEKGLREFWLECSNALDNMPLDDETRHAIKTAKSKAYEQWRALPL